MLIDYARQFVLPVEIPVGQSGAFSIQKVTYTPEQAQDLRYHDWMNGTGKRAIPAGTYTQLFENGTLWMSDTPAEQEDHLNFVAIASGHVLITGLGIGMVAAACLRKPDVSHVTVVEFQLDVITLVEPSLRKLAESLGKHLQVVCADAYAWVPSRKYDFAWHDIWPTISADDAEKHTEIMEHYAPWVVKGQECWVEAQVSELVNEQLFGLGLGGELAQKVHSDEFALKSPGTLEGWKI